MDIAADAAPRVCSSIRASENDEVRVGLPPMAEYVRLLAEQTKLPVAWPPRR